MIVVVDGSGSSLAKADVEEELVEPISLASCTASGSILSLSRRESNCGLTFACSRDGGGSKKEKAYPVVEWQVSASPTQSESLQPCRVRGEGEDLPETRKSLSFLVPLRYWRTHRLASQLDDEVFA